MLIDTHTHLYMPEFATEGELVCGSEAVKRAIEAGVEHMVFPNVDLGSIEPMRALHAAFPAHTSMAMGIHPTEVKTDWESPVQHCIDLLEINKDEYVAIGEIGIDLYWDKTCEQQQMLAFDRQLSIAEKLGKPVIIHCREGIDQTLEVLRGYPSVKAVFHSFGGSERDVEKIRNVGDYLFGINGVVTFKNSHAKDSLPSITAKRMILETDAPFLAPVPYRGKRNESAFIVETARFIANHLGMRYDELAAITTSNARQFFNI